MKSSELTHSFVDSVQVLLVMCDDAFGDKATEWSSHEQDRSARETSPTDEAEKRSAAGETRALDAYLYRNVHATAISIGVP